MAKAYGAIGALPAAGVVLRGSYQRQGETPIFVFEQNAATIFTLNSNVLTAVALERVVFNTLSSDADGLVRSRFLMSGALEFAVLKAPAVKEGEPEAADLLSFGQMNSDPPYAAVKGLRFSGLDVSMTSPAAAPAAVTFVFETGRLALDSGASLARPHSLYADLALELDSFIVGAEDKRPVDFGFLPVSVEPKLQTISGPWFGVVYNVTLGSPGALVSRAGFASSLLVAWAPSTQAADQKAALFVGLQLPGASPGAKLFSLQGVLKLTINSLVLRREALSGDVPAFVLRLNNVGLTFLAFAKLPPGAAINFFLFGDPEGNGGLGWYAAYQATPDPQLAEIEPPASLPTTAPIDHAETGP